LTFYIIWHKFDIMSILIVEDILGIITKTNLGGKVLSIILLSSFGIVSALIFKQSGAKWYYGFLLGILLNILGVFIALIYYASKKSDTVARFKSEAKIRKKEKISLSGVPKCHGCGASVPDMFIGRNIVGANFGKCNNCGFIWCDKCWTRVDMGLYIIHNCPRCHNALSTELS
jgi:hypothetical protein